MSTASPALVSGGMMKRGRGRPRNAKGIMKRGRGRPRKNNLPSYAEFMKVFLPDLSLEQLRIPPYFVKNFRGIMREKSKLKGPDGKFWDVTLEENNEGVFIKDGWKPFSDHHSLMLGEFLIFKHQGNSLFSVKIFRRNGCKAEAARIKIEVESDE